MIIIRTIKIVLTHNRSMKIWLIQSSLNTDSKTAILVWLCIEYCKSMDIDYTLIDLREYTVPFCDGRAKEDYASEDIERIWTMLEECTHYIIGMPVYQYTFSGVLKNFLDIFWMPMKEKAFGIVENSGSVRAYLAPTWLIDSLFFEFWAIPVPPVVHTHTNDYEWESMVNDHVHDKIAAMIANLQRVAKH